MSERDCVAALRLIVDNTKNKNRGDFLLKKAVEAYWLAQGRESPLGREDAALEILFPLRAGCPRGLAQKAEILANMVETRRSAEEIAGFAASIADDAISVSRTYLNRAM